MLYADREMSPIWTKDYPHMIPTWTPYDPHIWPHMIPIWSPYDPHMIPLWSPYDPHMIPIFILFFKDFPWIIIQTGPSPTSTRHPVQEDDHGLHSWNLPPVEVESVWKLMEETIIRPQSPPSFASALSLPPNPSKQSRNMPCSLGCAKLAYIGEIKNWKTKGTTACIFAILTCMY